MAKEKERIQEEKKKGGKLKWIILLVLLLGLAGGGAFAYFKYIQPMLSEKTDSAEEKPAEEKEKEQKAAFREIVSLPPMIVNLADPLGRRYLKVSIDVEVNSQTGAKKIKETMPQIKDTLLLLLSSKTYADLASIAHKLDLKTEIVSRLNQVMEDAFITQVYFTEFVIQ